MTEYSFLVLSAARLPIITVDGESLASHGIGSMISDFEALLSSKKAFVLLMVDRHRGSEQSHDDQKRWMLWLKGNRDRMAEICRGVVSVKDTSSDSALQEKQAAGMQAMLGIPVKLADNSDEAERIATDLLN